MASDWITPDWPAPASVRAISTTRAGGVSRGPYASLNLGAHVGDDPRAVAENRLYLRDTLGLTREPHWLRQVHGRSVVLLKRASPDETVGDPRKSPAGDDTWESSEGDDPWESPTGDSAVTHTAGSACVIMTADCLPVLLCDRAGKTVAAAHCGWRGLAAGVLENTIATMRAPPADILAWLGPAIGADVYQVGDEVRATLVKTHPEADEAFEPQPAGKWLCDLYLIASQRLRRAGVTHIYGGGFCTCSERERFFSYRRDGECGRMASLIWLES
jgi:YfiH family protein